VLLSFRYLEQARCIIPTVEGFVRNDPDDNDLATAEEAIQRYVGKLWCAASWTTRMTFFCSSFILDGLMDPVCVGMN
jgi:hypothetical protein